LFIYLIQFRIHYIYVCTFHRSSDCEMIANYRVQAELSAIDSTHDGKSIVLGTVDGCVSVLAIADPKKSEMKEYLANVPSRDEQVRNET